MGINISISVNPNTYLRNPVETELGRNIIKHGIELMAETGFQCFNFKHLAQKMQSTEASVYRYFENKHMLLVYLTSWYWEYLDFQIMLNTRNIDDPIRKLKLAVRTIVNGMSDSDSIDYVDLKLLHKLIVEQSPKVIHTKKVNECEEAGLFSNYKRLNQNISSILLECDPDFKYPAALSTNILKMAINHTYYAEHICSLTEITNCMETKKDQIENMIYYFLERLLRI